MKVLKLKETNKYLRITFINCTNDILTIDEIKEVDCLWNATALNKPVAVNVFNLLFDISCYELTIVEIPNNAL